MKNDIPFPTAQYIDPGIPEYANNPLIAALPPINDPISAASLFTKKPHFSKEEIYLPSHIRIHAISRLVNSFFVPFSNHILLEQKISALIRQAYLGRNPKEASFKKHLNNCFEKMVRKDLNAYIYDNVSSTALSMSLVGISGSGKSTTLNIILDSYNKTIFHPNFNLIQVPWLKVDCPHDGTLTELCFSIFMALDKRLNTSYFQKFSRGRLGIGKLLTEVANLCLIHAVGLLVIDEFQHMNMAKSGGEKKMVNFLVTLINTIGVSVILVGTPKALPIFASEFRQARRAAGHGNIVWDRIKNDESWDDFLDEVWKYQWLQNAQELTEELRGKLYDLSQGIADITIKLFCLAQARIILLSSDWKKEYITFNLLQDIYDEEFSVVKPMINALKIGDNRSLNEYNDIEIPDIESSLINTFDLMKQNTIAKRSNIVVDESDKPEIAKKAVKSLVDIGVSEDIAESLVQDAISSDPNISLLQIIQASTKSVASLSEDAKKEESSCVRKPKSWNQLSRKDIRKLYSEKTGGMYEVLLSNKLIFPVERFMA